MVDLDKRTEELRKLSREELIEKASNIGFIHHKRNYKDWDNEKVIKFVAMIEVSFEKAFSEDYLEEHEGI